MCFDYGFVGGELVSCQHASQIMLGARRIEQLCIVELVADAPPLMVALNLAPS